MARILFLAPQPNYQERGTPIAVDLALRSLESDGHQIDLVTYPEGADMPYRRVRYYRVANIGGVRNVRPGYSWQKLVYSSLMIISALKLSYTKKYDIIHAVEEACFIALAIKCMRKISYVYDMDSSIAEQLVEKKPALRRLSRVFQRLEGLAIRHANAVVAVCPALENLARKQGAKNVLLLQDISLLDRSRPGPNITNLRQAIDAVETLLLYVGNLEEYQGIDLLLEGMALAMNQGAKTGLAVIGGRADDIIRYKIMASKLGLANQVRFFGPRPITELGGYLSQADILVSPRTRGENTPMKIYTYLDSGKAILATNIYSHTQALDDAIACLVDPTPEGLAEGIVKLSSDHALRARYGFAGRQRVEERHSFRHYREHLNSFYRDLVGSESGDAYA